MKQSGKPTGNGLDLFDAVVMAVVVAFMLTLVAQVSAAPVPAQVDKRVPSMVSCNGLPLLIDTRIDGRTARLQQDAQHCNEGSNPLRMLTIWALSAR